MNEGKNHLKTKTRGIHSAPGWNERVSMTSRVNSMKFHQPMKSATLNHPHYYRLISQIIAREDRINILPPQGFGLWAKTRGGTLGFPACIHTRIKKIFWKSKKYLCSGRRILDLTKLGAHVRWPTTVTSKPNRSHQIQIAHIKFKSLTANSNRSQRITNHSQQITNHSQQIQIAHSKFKSFTAN